jgi:hypothetical protein
MWTSRSRGRNDEARYLERTADRLRTMTAAGDQVQANDPNEVRARLGRMRHGSTRKIG